MEIRYPTQPIPATAGYVLAVLQDIHRQQCQDDPEADPEAQLSLATTVEEWRNACNLVEWRELGRAYNKMWGIRCSDKDWHTVLEPARHKRLADVCQLIARHTVRPVIRPARLFGTTCTAAGAFLTIRSLLLEAGADGDAISPSTPLAPYTRCFHEVFLGPVSRLAPGALPAVRIDTPLEKAAGWGYLVGVLCLGVGWCGSLIALDFVGKLLCAAGGLMCAGSFALCWCAARDLPASVTFGELRTFRELAQVIAEHDAMSRNTVDGN